VVARLAQVLVAASEFTGRVSKKTVETGDFRQIKSSKPLMRLPTQSIPKSQILSLDPALTVNMSDENIRARFFYARQ
jgi:hypothetical protein